MDRLPILFSYRTLVVGSGFVAEVCTDGFALLEKEGEETWISGVTPVGIVGGGTDRNCAAVEFHKAWTEVLFDIASETRTFEEFETKCRTFLASSVPALRADWDQLLDEVRKSNYTDPTMPRKVAREHVATFEVKKIAHLTPDQNKVSREGLQAAA